MANLNGIVAQDLAQYAQYPDLSGRKILVTGSSSGIGKAVALAFASQLSSEQSSKSCICVTSRSSSRLQLVVHEIQKLGAEGFAVTGDLTLAEDCTNIVNEAARLMGGLDILVNSGATFTDAGAANHGNCSEIDFQESYKIHVASTVATTQAAIPHLRKRKGAVVNISSVASQAYMPAQIAYNTAKAMQDSVTRNYAMRYAKEGIRFNSVNPGYTSTDVFDTLAKEQGMSRADFQASTAVKHPMGRNATPQDIAAAVLFLSSQSASFITGAILPVSGGMTLTSWLNLEDQPEVSKTA